MPQTLADTTRLTSRKQHADVFLYRFNDARTCSFVSVNAKETVVLAEVVARCSRRVQVPHATGHFVCSEQRQEQTHTEHQVSSRETTALQEFLCTNSVIVKHCCNRKLEILLLVFVGSNALTLHRNLTITCALAMQSN